MEATQVAHVALRLSGSRALPGRQPGILCTRFGRHLSPDHGRLARLAGHWLPQALALASLVLLVQVAIAPLLLASAVLCLLVPANNKKVTLLREPLLPSDVALVLRQAHTWRLLGRYVPRPRRAILGLSAGAVVLAAAMIWEPWLLGRYRLGWPSVRCCRCWRRPRRGGANRCWPGC